MQEFEPVTRNVDDGGTAVFKDNVILRGVVGRGARLAAKGHIKLGAYSDLGEGVTVSAPSGAVVLSDKFKIPCGLRLQADQIFFNDAALPATDVLSGAITCESPNIQAGSAFFMDDRQPVHFRAPEGSKDTFLQLGTADGRYARVEEFDTVMATHLKHFSLSPNKPCGINCRDFEAHKVEDSLIRAHLAKADTVLGKVEFMPQNGAYDYGTKIPGILPGKGHIGPALWDRLLKDQGSHEHLRLSVREILTRVAEFMDEHQRDFARYSESVRKVRESLKQVEGMDAMLTTDQDRKTLDELLRRTPEVNIPQMLYRHAKNNFDIASPYRADVIVRRVGDEKKPADMRVHFGNVTVRESVAENSTLSVDSGMVTLGEKDRPFTIGKNTTIRANEIHLHELPSEQMLQQNNIRLQGQVYVNGELIEGLSNLRSGPEQGR